MDLEKSEQPDGIRPVDAYRAVRAWYLHALPEFEGSRKDGYGREAAAYVRCLPSADHARDLEIWHAFQEVITGLLEWGYHQSDGKFTMADYAHAAAETAGRVYWLNDAESAEFDETPLARCWRSRRQDAAGQQQAVEESVARGLVEAGFDVQFDASFAGTRPDLVATNAQGRVVVVDFKSTVADTNEVLRASEQARLYREGLGADAAVVVMSDADPSLLPSGVSDPSGAVATLLDALTQSTDDIRSRPSAGTLDRTIFAAMPFSPEFEDTFFLAMAPACEAAGGACVRVDHEEFIGDVVAEIKSQITGSAALIADVSNARPNVLYELGYATALGIPIVQISSSPLDELPFDIRNENTIRYDTGRVHQLRSDLETRLLYVLEEP